jgi:glucose uptake protein GlcU
MNEQQLRTDARYNAICLIACATWGAGSFIGLVSACQHHNALGFILALIGTITFTIGAVCFFGRFVALIKRL